MCEEARCSVVGAGYDLSVQGRVLGLRVKERDDGASSVIRW